MRDIMRIVVIAVLVFMMAQDMKEIITDLASSETMKPVIEWMYSGRSKSNRNRRSTYDSSSSEEEEESLDSSSSSLHMSGFNSEDDHHGSKSKDNNNPMYDPALEAVRKKLQAVGYSTVNGQQEGLKSKSLEFNEDEKQQLISLKTHLTNVMQTHCLPKLVCELHASVSERGTLTEAERGLLSLIRETSLGTMGEVVSRYHFAAHMGQLLSGVDGNGCHNLYPNCPLSGNKVLSMVKKVRIR